MNRGIYYWWNHRADKPVTILITILHLLAVLIFFPQFFSWSGVVCFCVLYFVSGGIGITLGYHRFLTHKSFKTSKFIKFILTFCACLAWQGSPLDWVGTHRAHHKNSDKEGDPHSPIHGFFWSHIIWVLTKVPEDFNATDWVADLKKDKMMLWFHRYWWLPQVIVLVLLLVFGFVFGGLFLAFSLFLWGGPARICAVFHGTWFVNSATHKWGYQNFKDTGDNSRNLWWVALISFGEGWHNNHHANQSSAAHGLRRFEFDLTYQLIKLMRFARLAWDVKVAYWRP